MNNSAPYQFNDAIFDFERKFRYQEAVSWMSRNWTTSYYLVTAYLIFLYWGQRYMRNRRRFEIKGWLFLWNLSLATFSVVGTLRTFPVMVNTVTTDGFHYSMCGQCDNGCSPVGHVWLYGFVMSKAIELGDTFFVVARKQPLYFLHWYHHVTVLLYSWYSYASLCPSGRWFCFINIAVHSLMYTYFLFKSLKVTIPRSVAMMITIAQLSQMIFGCYVTYYVYDAKRRGLKCHVSDENIQASALMYASFFCLFLWYFYQAYVAKQSLKNEISGKLTKVD